MTAVPWSQSLSLPPFNSTKIQCTATGAAVNTTLPVVQGSAYAMLVKGAGGTTVAYQIQSFYDENMNTNTFLLCARHKPQCASRIRVQQKLFPLLRQEFFPCVTKVVTFQVWDG